MKLTTLLPILPVALAASATGNTKHDFTVKAAIQGSEFDGLSFSALFNSFFLGHSLNVTAFIGDDGDALAVTTPLNQEVYVDSAGHLRYTSPSIPSPSIPSPSDAVNRLLRVSHGPNSNDNGNFTLQDEDGKEAGFLACPIDGPGGIAGLVWQVAVTLPDEVLPEGLKECIEFWAEVFEG